MATSIKLENCSQILAGEWYEVLSHNFNRLKTAIERRGGEMERGPQVMVHRLLGVA
jgi:hypothetical protein